MLKKNYKKVKKSKWNPNMCSSNSQRGKEKENRGAKTKAPKQKTNDK